MHVQRELLKLLGQPVRELGGNLVMAGARGVLGGEIVKAVLRNDLHDRQWTVVQDRDREFPAVDVLLDQRRRAVGERRGERGPEGARFAGDTGPRRPALSDTLGHQGGLVRGGGWSSPPPDGASRPARHGE